MPLPPSAESVALYTAWLSHNVDTTGSVEDAFHAIGFLAIVNAGGGWGRTDILSGRAYVPVEALRRRHAHAVAKAPGLPVHLVRRILDAYVVALRLNLPWEQR